MANWPALTVTALLWATCATAQGVPTIDPALIARNEATNAQRERDLAIQRQKLAVREQIAEIERQQLAVLNEILAAQSSAGAQDISGMVAELEAGTGPEGAAATLYAAEDSNLASAQLFGDAAPNVEQLIIRVAQETHGMQGVGQAGFSVREWRFMLQAMIWQESRFSIGARSPMGAFGLTQIMPETAKELGIHPAYYDDPYLQVHGGARYLAQRLNEFDGDIILALAAYNSGAGNVRRYGGVPPFAETQHYVQVIPQKYNEYLAMTGGADAVGTIEPGLMANSNLSFTGSAVTVYASNSMATIEASAQRLTAIVERIGETEDVHEAMALNSYARAENGRLLALFSRLLAARAKPASAAALAQATERQQEKDFMDFDMGGFGR